MIDLFSDKLSSYLKNKYPEELPALSIVRYSIKFLISNVLPIIIIILSSILFQMTKEVVIGLLGFCILRMFSGGYHVKSAELCILTSVTVIYLIAIVGQQINSYMIVLDLISIILVGIYAPSNIKKQTRIKEENYRYLKLMSLIIVTSNIFIQSNILSVAFLIQSITLIRNLNSMKEVKSE
ncbi:accessory gene regulator ArgB-like protein [Paenibacillus sp. XY044]|uniref:accessory gene regulator ArgB-like protein n=1 Tax=Paenibacillus sp. XY044 TaxID=2026089 RepID=UPI000B99207C|nr:accessory gene regulator B family protein [Paenibacillus sp. XY044]OZB98077.1 hypothetical protein CJP46_02605 [Paenibacillus sp. XY044]